MNLRTRLMYTVAGTLLVNSAPHFVVGLTGRRNSTPFGRNSSPRVNILWGAMNFAGATVLVSRADAHMQQSDARNAWTLPVMTGGFLWSTFMFLYELRARVRHDAQQ